MKITIIVIVCVLIILGIIFRDSAKKPFWDRTSESAIRMEQQMKEKFESMPVNDFTISYETPVNR